MKKLKKLPIEENIIYPETDWESFIKSYFSVSKYPLSEQISYYESLSLLEVIHSFAGEYIPVELEDFLAEKLIAEQNSFFLEIHIINYNQVNSPKIFKKILPFFQRESILNQLSDDNLIKLYSLMDARKEDTQLILSVILKRFLKMDNQLFYLPCKEFILEDLVHFDKTNQTYQKLREIHEAMPLELKQLIRSDIPNLSLTKEISISRIFNNPHIYPYAMEVLESLIHRNWSTFTKFHIELLEDIFIEELGVEYIKEMGIYDSLSNQLYMIAKTDKRLFHVMSKIILSLKESYPVPLFYKCNEWIIQFFAHHLFHLQKLDSELLTSSSLLDYIFYTQDERIQPKITIPFTKDYSLQYEKECEESYQDSTRLSYPRAILNSICQRNFHSSAAEMESFLKHYQENIDTLNVEDNIRKCLKELQLLFRIGSEEELKQYYVESKTRYSYVDLLEIEKKLMQAYAKTYEEEFQKTKDVLEGKTMHQEKIFYQDRSIPVFYADKLLSMLVYSSDTGYLRTNRPLINNNYRTTWYHGISPEVHSLSTCYYAPNHLGAAPLRENGVLYGFYTVKLQDIAYISPYDMGAHKRNYGYDYISYQPFIKAQDIAFHALGMYSEVLVNRLTVAPDCVIVWKDMNPILKENAYHAAHDWNIPIVVVDRIRMVRQNILDMEKNLEEFQKSHDIAFMRQVVYQYEALNFLMYCQERMVSGYIEQFSFEKRMNTKKWEERIRMCLDDLDISNKKDLEVLKEFLFLLTEVESRYDSVRYGCKALFIANPVPQLDITSLRNYAQNKVFYKK